MEQRAASKDRGAHCRRAEWLDSTPFLQGVQASIDPVPERVWAPSLRLTRQERFEQRVRLVRSGGYSSPGVPTGSSVR